MSSINKVILIGRVGKVLEFKQINDKNCVVNFSLATSEKYKKQDGSYEELTEWHNIVMWNKSAELANKLINKGTLLYLEGKLSTKKWEDKSGTAHYTTSVVADKFTLLSDGKKTEKQGADNNSNGYKVSESLPAEEIPQIDDDLPF